MEERFFVELLPADSLEKLEFIKIKEYIANLCVSEIASTYIKQEQPLSELDQIIAQRKIVLDILHSIRQHELVPLATFIPVKKLYPSIKAANSNLETDAYFQIKQVLQNLESLKVYFGDQRINEYPALYRFWTSFSYDEVVYNTIDKVIDETGSVRANASPELVRISKSIQSEERSLDAKFNKLITHYKKEGWLTDNEESVRNGRRVLSIKSEHKRKLQGIIHDESATGKTSFIEPQDIVLLNNNLFDLWMDHRKEVRQILINLSDIIRPYLESMIVWEERLIQLDQMRAKAMFGNKIKGSMPKISNQDWFDLKKARHPLLLLKQEEGAKEIVPLNMHLGKTNRFILLSGPNAGGKSVALKTIGLIQLMAQAAIPIPVDSSSELRVFKKIFVDIGDQQSIEDDLSTYSSRLTLMRNMLNTANDNTLILIDEFGSGTDPQIGGAIAAEILIKMLGIGSKGVITTHYSNLKIIADKQKGIVNGAMMFDKHSLQPTYQMRIGKPGSSYALEIAAQCGLDHKIIEHAKQRMGNGIYRVDKLLSDLEDEKQRIDLLIKTTEAKEAQLDKLMKNYERMSTELEVKRKKLKLRTKEMDLQYQHKYQQQLDKSIRELKKMKDLERVKDISKQAQIEKQQIKEEVKTLDEAIYLKTNTKAKPIKIGSFVKHEKSGVSGELLRIEKSKGVVQVGTLTMTIPIKELKSAREPLPHKPQKSIQTHVMKSAFDFKTQLDIRGLNGEEAIRVVESFVDQALMANAFSVKILHGKGNGILKKLVKEKLAEYQAVDSISHPDNEWGGDGITIAKFAR